MSFGFWQLEKLTTFLSSARRADDRKIAVTAIRLRMTISDLVPIVRPAWLRNQDYDLRLGPDYLSGLLRYNYWLKQDREML